MAITKPAGTWIYEDLFSLPEDGRRGVREFWIVDPASRAVKILALDRDALHTVRRASGEDTVVSSLLRDAAFRLMAIFAGGDQHEP